MNFNNTEKVSVARLLWGLLVADNDFDPRECEAILEGISIDGDTLIKAREYSYNLSISNLKAMNEAQKSTFCGLLLKVMNADEITRQSELDYIDKLLVDAEMLKDLITYDTILYATIAACKIKRKNGFA